VIADYEVHKLKVLARLKHKVNHAMSNDKPLLCIGFQLPDFRLSDLSIYKKFTKPVYFSSSKFLGESNFSAHFQRGASFDAANFQGGVGENAKENRFKILDERLLEEKIKEEEHHTKDFNLGSIKAVYREVLEKITNTE
jgi:hypothetical protein